MRLGTRPERDISEYLASKSNRYLRLKRKTYDTLDVPRIILEREQRKLYKVESKLDQRRRLFQQQKIDLNQQWDKLREDEKEFCKQFEQFNKFIKENEAKRSRTLVNIKETKKLSQNYKDNIENLATTLVMLKQKKEEMDKQIRAHIIFEGYLHDVLEAATDDQFKNIDDIIKRYEYYVEIKQTLALNQEKTFQEFQDKINQLMRFNETNHLVLLGLANQLTGLQGRYDEVSRRTRSLETLVASIRSNIEERYNEIALVKASIWNNYIFMCKRRRLTSKYKKEDTEKQLIFIKESLRELQEIKELLMEPLSKNKVTKRLTK